MKKVDGLSKYSKMPIKAETKEVNKVSSYGTAFSPLFISIALWVGSLMLFMVLYFDKEKRFGLLGIDSVTGIWKKGFIHKDEVKKE